LVSWYAISLGPLRKLTKSIDGHIGLYYHSVHAGFQQEEGKVSLMQPGGTELMVRPEGNDRYVRNAPKNPKETRWMYDDDVSPLSRDAAIQAYEIDCIRAWGFGS
jgi:hypothetical protein